MTIQTVLLLKENNERSNSCAVKAKIRNNASEHGDFVQ